MKNYDVTNLPIEYLHSVEKELQGTLTEVTYKVSHYIDHSRNLVSAHEITSKEAGRTTVNGEPIEKKCNVYLPAGYRKDDVNTRYRVLYLLHGVGGDRFEWLSANGVTDDNYNICNIFDHLIADGEIEPLIVVFPDGRSAYDWTDRSFNAEGTNMLGFYYFDYEVRYDLIPFIESAYNTLADINDKTPEGIAYNRLHRALAGLSMGGMQALNLGIGGMRCESAVYTGTAGLWKNGLDTTVPAPGMLDLFAYIGAFSNAPTSSDGKLLGSSIASCGHQLELLYITCGNADGIAYEAGYVSAVEGLSKAAEDHLEDYYKILIKNGVHDFNVWNNGAYNFARLAFRDYGKNRIPADVNIILGES